MPPVGVAGHARLATDADLDRVASCERACVVY
jgi:hypothetical protein